MVEGKTVAERRWPGKIGCNSSDLHHSVRDEDTEHSTGKSYRFLLDCRGDILRSLTTTRSLHLVTVRLASYDFFLLPRQILLQEPCDNIPARAVPFQKTVKRPRQRPRRI
jgi:hypothetical protein